MRAIKTVRDDLKLIEKAIRRNDKLGLSNEWAKDRRAYLLAELEILREEKKSDGSH